jgi:osmotically-inducible protein OsmY
MVDKVQRARRISGIAIGAVRAIFRSGRAWGVARTRLRTTKRPVIIPPASSGVVAGVVAGAAGVYFLDPQSGKRRRHVAFDRAASLLRRGAAEGERKAKYAAGVAKGAAYESAGAGEGAEDLPDPELANKVRTEIFRDAEAPKGDVSVNAENGVVYLRGELSSTAQVEAMEAKAREVAGVRDVVNLLHLPGEPAPAKEPEGAPVSGGR